MKTAVFVLLTVIVTVTGLYFLPEDLNWLGLALGQMVTFFLLGYDVCPFSIAYTLAAFTAGEIGVFTLSDIAIRLNSPLLLASNQNFNFAMGATNVLSYCVGSVCGFSRYKAKHSCPR